VSKEDIKKSYEHYYKEADKTEFPQGYKFYLVHTVERFNKMMSYLKTKKFVGADLETTSLDYSVAKMVGVSVSAGEKMGFYCPFRHEVDSHLNLPLECFKELCEYWATVETRWYNFLFDGQIIELEGGNVEDWKISEVMHKVFNADTNWKKINAKWAARHFLGWEMQKFGEVLDENVNFAYVSPKDAVFYAGSDALAAYELDEYLTRELKEKSSFIMELDNQIVIPFLRILQTEQYLSEKVLDDVALEVIEEAPKLEQEIYNLCGRVFKIGSPEQVADVLDSLGIDTGVRGKIKKDGTQGHMKTGAEYLERIEHPIAEKIIRYKQITTWENNYVKPLKRKLAKNEPVRLSYFLTGVPCLTENAQVVVNNELKSIKEVKKGDLILTQHGEMEVKGAWCVGEDETYKVKTRNGVEVEGNLGHPFLVKRESKWRWVKIKELREGDKIKIAPLYDKGVFKGIDIGFIKGCERGRKEIVLPKKMTLSLCRLMGFIAGDGSVTKDKVKLCFWKEDRDLIKYYSGLMRELFNLEVGESVGKDNTVTKNYCSMDLKEFFEYVEVKKDGLPSLITRSGVLGVLEYIGGYFDADGSISRVNGKVDVRIGSKSRNRIRECSNFLNLIGIKTHIGEKNAGQLYLRIKGVGNAELFLHKVNPVCYRKSWKGPRRFSVVDYDIVKQVKSIGKRVLYDIEVGEVNEFLVNGLVTHNTGRTKAGKDKDNPVWFTGINVQAVVKPSTVKRWAHYSGSEEGILGWEFLEEKVSEEDYVVEFPDPSLNIRKAFAAPEGWIFAKFDFAGQELRIPANLSGEPVWVEAFLNGEDIHAKVATEVFGEVNSEIRKQAKVVNFSILYGSTSYSFAKKFNKSQEESDAFYLKYKSKHRKLFAWVEAIQKQAARSGVVYTAFGRPRRLYHWFASFDMKVKAFARRSAINSLVQGTAADILRISIVKYYKRIWKKYADVVKFRMTVHDEIDVQIRRDSLFLIDLIEETLTFRRKDWPVPLTVGVELGTSWGDLVEFEKKDGTWVPKKK